MRSKSGISKDIEVLTKEPPKEGGFKVDIEIAEPSASTSTSTNAPSPQKKVKTLAKNLEKDVGFTLNIEMAAEKATLPKKKTKSASQQSQK